MVLLVLPTVLLPLLQQKMTTLETTLLLLLDKPSILPMAAETLIKHQSLALEPNSSLVPANLTMTVLPDAVKELEKSAEMPLP